MRRSRLVISATVLLALLIISLVYVMMTRPVQTPGINAEDLATCGPVEALETPTEEPVPVTETAGVETPEVKEPEPATEVPPDISLKEDPYDFLAPTIMDGPRGELIVSLPPHPGGAVGRGHMLCVEAPSGETIVDTVTLGTRREDHTFHQDMGRMVIPEAGVPQGTWNVYLKGSGFNGYTPAPLHEVVSVEIKEGQTSRATLPDIAAAPWQFSASNLRVKATCGGEETRIHGPLMYGEAGERRASGDWLPTGIRDGDEVVPSKFIPPANDDGDAWAVFEFETRVAVHITAGGATVAGQYLVELTNEDGTFRMSDYTYNGTSALWAPRGKATLVISAAERSEERVVFTRTVTVNPGEVVNIEAELEFVEVKLTGGWRDIDKWIWCVGAADWAIVRLDGEKPQVLRTLAFGRTHRTILTLPRGLYRAIPLTGDVESAVEFDVRDGLARTVDLPKLSPASLGEVLLTLDVDVQQATSVNARLYWQPASEAPEMREHNYNGVHLHAKYGERGLSLTNAPVGADVYVYGTLEVHQAEGPWAVYVLKPVRVNVNAPGVALSAETLPARRLSGSTGKLSFSSVSLVPGHAFPIQWFQVPIGESEILVRNPDGTPALREQINIAPGDGRIPDSLFSKLQKLMAD